MRKLSKLGLRRKLDKIVGTWCRKVRSNGVCEHCGCKPIGVNSQWCHIKSRKYYVTRWSPNNCVHLCATCHAKFTDNPDMFVHWLDEKMPEQMSRLCIEFNGVIKCNEIWLMSMLDTIEAQLEQFKTDTQLEEIYLLEQNQIENGYKPKRSLYTKKNII